MLISPSTTARVPKSQRTSCSFCLRVRLDGPLDQFDHGDALIAGEREDPLAELWGDLQVELPAFGAAVSDPATIGGGEWPRLASPPASQRGGGVALSELGQDG